MTENNTINKPKLIIAGLIRFILVLIVFSILLIFSAGSFKYWNAWIFIGSFFLPDLLLIIYLVIKDPELLQKRLKIKEKEKTQKIFNIYYYITATFTLIISGLDFRFQWSNIPICLVITSAAIMIFGFIISFIVMKQNIYASRVIEIQKGQKLIDTGLYSVVRHPMYLSAIIIFCPMPLVLGSFYAFIMIVIIVPLLLLIRILNEEKVLKHYLNGYEEYMKKVKYRLIPFIW